MNKKRTKTIETTLQNATFLFKLKMKGKWNQDKKSATQSNPNHVNA
jgi:hypothetical protein